VTCSSSFPCPHQRSFHRYREHCPYALNIYFNCGQQDNYGFEKGAADLHVQLQKENVTHEYHSYPGDHSVNYFLSHFAEVMEFHSRAFHFLPAR